MIFSLKFKELGIRCIPQRLVEHQANSHDCHPPSELHTVLLSLSKFSEQMVGTNITQEPAIAVVPRFLHTAGALFLSQSWHGWQGLECVNPSAFSAARSPNITQKTKEYKKKECPGGDANR